MPNMEVQENTKTLRLNTHKILRRTTFNRIYIAIYSLALVALFYHHLLTLFRSPSISYFLLLVSDLVLSFSWVSTQAFHVRPIRRQEFVENLQETVLKERSLHPSVDIFICTADPYKEPPIGTVNTALSVMAYDYPPEKSSIYVSDDGGSQITFLAFVEAAKFARHWLPFCRENHLVERSPEAYFASNSYASSTSPEADKLKTMYESMKVRIENTLERGCVTGEHIDDEATREALAKWTPGFTSRNHQTVIQVLLANTRDKDATGEVMPNLIYVSRQKNKDHHHRFKAGALNTLVRVSATMTNAPIVLTLDCDMSSNDPQTVKRVLCYFLDPSIRHNLGYVQFPQMFTGLNKGDIYGAEHKRLFQINAQGMDGLQGPNYVGTGSFFQRRAFFGSPKEMIEPEIPKLNPSCCIEKPIDSPELLASAHQVAACDYEDNTGWGTKLGFRYGSLVEDYYTGYRMQCEGWKGYLCHPKRPAFLGGSPSTLIDLLGQCKRWCNGLLDVLCSKYSTITYGVPRLGLGALAFNSYAIWPIQCIPLTIYAYLPQLALLNGVSIFPKVTGSWLLVYIFLFVGANAKDLFDYLIEKGTFERWWNSQRIYMISGVTCYLFACIEYTLSSLGVSVRGFDVTSKVQDDELSKRYDQGIYEFGVDCPMFVSLTMAAMINLISLVVGAIWMITRETSSLEGLILQTLLSGFVVINCWPIYEAMAFRTDKGRMPTKTTLAATFLVSLLCLISWWCFS